MHFSRAMFFAAFTALKWLSLVSAVLFAALAMRYAYDGAGTKAIAGSLATAAIALLAALVLHKLARSIQP